MTVLTFTLSFSSLPATELDYLKKIGKIYFLFLFFYSGLEYTLTFLTHIHLNFTR